MKKNSILLIFIGIFIIIPTYAQTYTDAIDSIFSHISRTDATTGIIYERVLSFGNLTHYNSLEEQPDTSNFSHFLRAYNEICRATFLPSITMIPLDTL